MPILLDKEEIRNCWPAGQGKGYTPTPFDYAIRQAQLKKVVEILGGFEIALDRQDKFPMVYLRILGREWQALKKAAGLNDSEEAGIE